MHIFTLIYIIFKAELSKDFYISSTGSYCQQFSSNSCLLLPEKEVLVLKKKVRKQPLENN